jgi:Mg-chelatase subunit ChlD
MCGRRSEEVVVTRIWRMLVASIVLLACSALVAGNVQRSGVLADSSIADILEDACRAENPYFVTSRHYGDLITGGFAGHAAVIGLQDSLRDDLAYRYPENPRQIVLARYRAVGSIHGIAYDWRSQQVFAAASYGVGVGPRGHGHVYRIALAGPTTLPGIDLDGGPSYGPLDEQWASGFGRVSLGDIDADEDSTTLFVVNLYDRKIHSFALPDLAPQSTFDVGGRDDLWGANARPFGLAVRGGWLYHGVVDSREDPSLPGKLSVYIYRSRFDGSDMIEVARAELDYLDNPRWVRWTDPVPWAPTVTERQPLVVDIDFRPNGDPVIGLGSRIPLHHNQGDILATVRQQPLRWLVVTDQETYADDIPPVSGAAGMAESNYGALAAFPGLDSVVGTGAFAFALPDGGLFAGAGMKWFENSTGLQAGPNEGAEIASTDLPGLGDIEALCPRSVPPTETPTRTPTAEIPSPTPTPSRTDLPSSTPSATNTAAPTPTRTPTAYRIFLPMTAKRSCLRARKGLDIVLVLDASTSMTRLTSVGRPKIEASEEAALSFLRLLDLDHVGPEPSDRAAIVGFNDTAWIAQPLATDYSRLAQAVAHLRTQVAEGTRLDLALEAGTEAVGDRREPASRPAFLVLLTDGLPNRVPTPDPVGPQEETVIRMADKAKAHGITVYAIGLGRADAPELVDRINPALLRAVASREDMYYESPDAEDLAEMYATIAHDILCPPGVWR